jgi:tellurite methyltransferase
MKYLKENYVEFFGKVENESSYGKPGKVVELIPSYLESGTVLDLGAGDGRHALFLASKGFEVKAIDISEAGLEKLKRFAEAQKLSVKTEHEDLSSWSIDQDYDVMVSTSILQHLPTKQAMRILEEMKQHTRPNGLNAISLFTNNGDRYRMDREDDPDAFYPAEGWLKEYYKDWEILNYDESSGNLIGKNRPDGTPMSNIVAKLLARKPAA